VVEDVPALTIDVERPDTPDRLRASPAKVFFEDVGDEFSLDVSGVFRDGAILHLSHSTYTRFKSDSPAVAAVDASGHVTAKGAGSTTIRIEHRDQSITVPVTVPGSTYDLRGDDGGNGMSDALWHLTDAAGNRVPTGMIAGSTTPANLSARPRIIGLVAGALCNDSPIANTLLSEGWNGIFSGRPNDGVVSVDSQFALKTGNAAVPGTFHSGGLTALGFRGSAEISAASGTADKVLELLRKPATTRADGGVFFTLP
jgi:hypothetical protein